MLNKTTNIMPEALDLSSNSIGYEIKRSTGESGYCHTQVQYQKEKIEVSRVVAPSLACLILASSVT